ncbi:MAG: sialidase family protein [Thiobacillus sp.]|nr:sialidase family protein [Thiobacillus sp.]
MRKGLSALLLAVPWLVHAQSHDVHLPQAVTHARPVKPVIAVGAALDPQGRLWLARVENQQLFVAHSADNGVHFSTPVRVTPEPEAIAADGENRPKIAVSADGVVLLSWTQALPQNYAGNIRFSRSIDDGKTFAAPITLNDDGRITSHRFDSLAIDGKGRVAVAWLDARDRDAARERDTARDAGREKGGAFSGVSVYTAQSTDNGASFSANRRLTMHTCECCRTAMAWTDAGPVVFWRNLYDVNTRDFALAQLDGGAVRRVTDDEWQIDACPHHGGGLAVDGRGALHLVWYTSGKNRQGLFYKRIQGAAPNANPDESPAMSLGDAAAQAGHPDVAAAGNLVLLTWREFNGKVYSAHAMRSDDGGTSWHLPIRLAEATGAADYPLPLTDGQRALVVWNAAAEGLRVLPVASGGPK